MLTELKYLLGLGKQRLDGKVEPQIIQSIQDFLNRNREAIGAMRTIHQVYDGQFKLSGDEISDLEQFVKTASHGELNWTKGNLCEIGENWQEFQHESSCFQGDLHNPKAVRGFWLGIETDNNYLEFVDLDGGKSRAYFDSLPDKAKTAFVTRFAYRHIHELDIAYEDIGYFIQPHSKPNHFVSFVSLNYNGTYRIEKAVARRPLIPFNQNY